MRRRDLLQRTGVGLTATVAVGLAGCSGDGDNGGGASGTTSYSDTNIETGEEAELILISGVDGSPDDVARYEITLSCEGFGVEGVYKE